MFRKLYYIVSLGGLMMLFNNFDKPQNLEQLTQMTPGQIAQGFKNSLSKTVSDVSELTGQGVQSSQSDDKSAQSGASQEKAATKSNNYRNAPHNNRVDNSVAEVADEETNSVIHDPSTDTYYYKGHNYVLVEGQYFPYNEENVYNVKGFRYFFRPKDKPVSWEKFKAMRDARVVAATTRSATGTQQTGTVAADSAESTETKSGSFVGLSSIANTFKKITQAKQKMQEHNNELENAYKE